MHSVAASKFFFKYIASVIIYRNACSGIGIPEKFMSKTSRLAEQRQLLVCNQTGKKFERLWYVVLWFVDGKVPQFWLSRICAASFITSTGSRSRVWTRVKFVIKFLVCVCVCVCACVIFGLCVSVYTSTHACMRVCSREINPHVCHAGDVSDALKYFSINAKSAVISHIQWL